MCSGQVEVAEITGSGKGARGWFALDRAQVVYDHPFHAQLEDALIIDFVNSAQGPGARVSVEVSARSARRLVQVIESALADGKRRHEG